MYCLVLRQVLLRCPGWPRTLCSVILLPQPLGKLGLLLCLSLSPLELTELPGTRMLATCEDLLLLSYMFNLVSS